MISMSLDGASERAVLAAQDGAVLHMNAAAKHFLWTPPSGKAIQVTDFLVVGPEVDGDFSASSHDWQSAKACHVVLKEKQKTSHNKRNIHCIKLDACPCCAQQYYTIYICSKHERVREVVDHAFDPVFTCDCSGIICTVNEAALTLFGYTDSKDMVGQNIKLICGGGHAANHDQYMKNYLETGVAHVIGKKREVMAKKKDGTEFPVELGIQEISDPNSGQRYFCGFVKDLTVIRKHEADLFAKQALAQAMIDASFDSMFEIDEAGIIQIVNDAACHMFGFSRKEFVGSNISVICGVEHAEKHAFYLKRYLSGGMKNVIGRKRQVKARRKDGSELEVELGVQEVYLADGKRAFCGFVRDMTEQRKDKRAMRKQQQLIHGKFFGSETGEGA